MEGFAYGCAVVLAAVFVRAGAAKLARPAATVAGFAALGVPGARAAGRVVPAAELVLAALLLAGPRAGAGAALGLLVLFSAFLARAVLAGSDAGCACFGAPRSEPISSNDLLRNAMLGALAVGALDASGPALPSLVAVALLAAGLLGGLGILRLAHRRGR